MLFRSFRLTLDSEKVAEMWESEYTGGRKYTLKAEKGRKYPVVILKAEKGRKYPVVIEYMQRLGSADLNFTVGVLTDKSGNLQVD